MSGVQPEATSEYYRFCGDRADIPGEAYTYVRWPDKVDRENGVFRFTICRDCALQERDNVEQAASLFHEADRDHLLTCDVCGAVGCGSASTRRPAAETYRVASIIPWSVSINGFDGTATSCTECSPIVPVDCVKRPDRTYDDEVPCLIEPRLTRLQRRQTMLQRAVNRLRSAGGSGSRRQFSGTGESAHLPMSSTECVVSGALTIEMRLSTGQLGLISPELPHAEWANLVSTPISDVAQIRV